MDRPPYAVYDARRSSRPVAKPFLGALSVLLVLVAATAVKAENGRPADCLLIVKGQEAIRGQCLFTPLDSDGSFTITGYNGQFFAYVLVEAKGVAQGYWNEEPYATHAHSPLGQLLRQDGCWVNSSASVCAY